MQNFSDFIVKCAIFEEHSSSCVVFSRFSGTLFPVSMIDGEINIMKEISVREMTKMVKLACVICLKHFHGQRK